MSDDSDGRDESDQPDQPDQGDDSHGAIDPGNGASGRPRWIVTPPREGIYALMWEAYRAGAQSVRALTRRCGVSTKVADTAIFRGWPENNWPPLRERWKLFERQAEAARERELQADRAAAESAGKTSATRWREHQEKWMEVAEMAPALVGEMGRRLKIAVGAATFVRYRKNKAGETEAYINASEVAKATALWVQAFKDAPQAMRYLLGPGALAPEPEVPELSDAQLEELNAGKLPDGINEQMLGAMLMRGPIEGGK